MSPIPSPAPSPSGDPLEVLRARVCAELCEPVRPSVTWLAEQIAAIHGPSVAGVLFYGSCLRKPTDEGVLDYWVVVDDYASAHESTAHAMVNRIAPPSVYYLERDYEGVTLRTKYGVLDRRAFERGTRLDAWYPYVWARFAQPARLLACRDENARRFFEGAVTHAVVTFVARLSCRLPDQAGVLRFSLPAFWRAAFRATYDTERRPEGEQTIRALYDENARRYDAAALDAFRHLDRQGHFEEMSEHPNALSITFSRGRLARARRRWLWMRPLSRTLGLLRLLKTAYTFGDWVPYVLWKLERHTGRTIELSPRQRRHPLIFGWPIILPLLMRRNLR